MERLKNRAEFLAAARGARVSRPGFVLQAAKAADADASRSARFGFTVTKKIGNAVVRNRIRRRLREAVRLAGAGSAVAGLDYVIVGRRAALTLPFERLVADLVGGIAAVAGKAKDEDRSGHV